MRLRTAFELIVDAVTEAFDEAGVEYALQYDNELGIEYPEWDESDELANEVVAEVFRELDAEYGEGDGEVVDDEDVGSHDVGTV